MDSPGADDRFRRLEGFLSQVTAGRRHLAGFLAALEGQADALSDHAASLETRLEAASQTVASLTQALETNHQHALAELSALAVVGVQVNEQAVGSTRGRLEETDAGFVRGLSHTRERLGHTAAELARVSGQAGHAALELEDEQEHHGQGLEAAGAALRLGVLDAGEKTHAIGTEILGSLDAARSYVAEGLEAHLGAAFGSFLSELGERVQPYLADSLGEVGRTVLRCFDELDELVESATTRLVDETEPVLRDLAAALEDWTREMNKRLEGSAQEALRPYLAEVERHADTVRRAQEIASDVAQLAPQLAAARHVADRIQEMLDVMNPFG